MGASERVGGIACLYMILWVKKRETRTGGEGNFDGGTFALPFFSAVQIISLTKLGHKSEGLYEMIVTHLLYSPAWYPLMLVCLLIIPRTCPRDQTLCTYGVDNIEKGLPQQKILAEGSGSFLCYLP